MSNPLTLKEFEHWLNFKTDDIGYIQISEPLKFDASEFVVEQDSKGYARDISFMAEEVSLEFYRGFFEKVNTTQELPNGIVTDKLGHALEYILEYNRDYGFQSEIEYVLRRNGVDFILGELNFEGATTDEDTYFKCKVVQSTRRALARRREDTEIDGFATEDLDGNTITPIQTQNILLKAKPVRQTSEWNVPNSQTFFTTLLAGGTQTGYYNYCNNVLKYQIDNTLTYFPGFSGDRNDFIYIRALNNLTNISLKVNINLDYTKTSGNITSGTIKLRYFISTREYDGTFNSDLDVAIGTFFEGSITDSTSYNINEEIIIDTFNSEAINAPIDAEIIIWFEQVVASTGSGQTGATITDMDIEIQATSTALDTVIKGVRYIDLAKQSLKAINGMELIAPDFDPNGEHYNLFATSGNLIRQRDDVPFYFNFKDRVENLMLINADIQINEDNAFCLKYDAFYDSVENGVFSVEPSESSEASYNQRYMINLLEWAFKNYEKDRDEENTLDSVHTEAQFAINNDKVKNTKKIDISDIFDPYFIEAQRSQVFKETTALDGDDKIFGIDVVPLAPGTLGGFSSSMTHNIQDGNVQLLKDADLPSWALLGFNVGSDFEIKNTENSGTYTVAEIENTVLTLTPVSPAFQTFEGVVFTTVEYPFVNVSFTNRTNEGFDVIDNLLNPENFANLRYTIRRNLVNWESYLSTSALYIDDNISNSKFKNNGLLITQYEGGKTYQEDADIVLTEIADPILTPRVYDVTVKVEYDEILDILRKYQVQSTVGGFIRVLFVNGEVKNIYPQKLGYTWATKKLNIVGEERFNNGFVTIQKINDITYINDVEYPNIGSDGLEYQNNGNYFAILDENRIKIVNFTEYTKFVVQEETFDNPSELAQALIDF